MLATTILMTALLVQAAQSERAPAPREMELLLMPREMELLPAPRELARLRTSGLNYSPELRRQRLANDFRDLERLNYGDIKRLDLGYRYTPMYDPFQKSKEEIEKDKKQTEDIKKFKEYSDAMAKHSRAEAEGKLEAFGIVVVLGIFIGILRGIFALASTPSKEATTKREYPEWMEEEKKKG